MDEFRKKIILILALIGSIISVGTAGYMGIEGWNFIDSLYMTVITLTTVGYREVHDLSMKGIIFTIFLLVGGVGVMLYALSTGARIILEGELKETFGGRSWKRGSRN